MHGHDCLGVEHQRGATADRAGDDCDGVQPAGVTLHALPLEGGQGGSGQILGVHQDRLAVGHAAVAVAHLVCRGVVLAVAAGGDQAEHQALLSGRQATEVAGLGQGEIGQGGGRQLGAAIGGGEAGAGEDAAGQLEFREVGVDVGNGLVAGHGAGDQLAHVNWDTTGADRDPGGGFDLGDQGLPTVAVLLHELLADGAALQQGLLQPEQQGDLAAASEHGADREGGRTECEQAGRQHRVDHDH